MRTSSAERKQQLIEATVELLRRDGVQRLTVRGIAEEAGANLATVSYCFDGKDDLLRHAFDYWLHRMLDLRHDGSEEGGGIRATIQRIADAYWSDLEATPADALAQLEFVTWAVRRAPEDALAQSIYEHSVAELSRVLQSALDASGESLSMTAADLARAFLMLIDGASLQVIADPGSGRHRAVFDQLLDLVLSGAMRAG